MTVEGRGTLLSFTPMREPCRERTSPVRSSHSRIACLLYRTRRAAAVLLVVAALAALTGCSKSPSAPTGTGDIAGLRLAAFASDRGNSSGQYDLYLWDFDTQAFREMGVTRSFAAQRHPTISSDGRFVAYQENSGSNGDDIRMLDRKGPGLLDLSPINTAADENEPAFSGNAKLLCYTQAVGGVRRIHLFDGTNGTAIALPGLDTTGTYNDYSPSPNYDASLIAFVSTRNGAPDIFIYDRGRKQVLDGPILRTALVSANDDLDPSFSQSGRFLSFASSRPGGSGGLDVYVLEFAVTSTHTDTLLRTMPLANSSSDERHPGISDSGNTLVFQSDRAGGQGRFDLWNYDRSTSTLSHPDLPSLYNSTGDDIEPSLKWSY